MQELTSILGFLALFGELARRMALANPGKDVNPLEGSGVVLIDELDLHMHTSWQRKVLNVLRDTFPNIQFIITTHSPQILGEMDDSVNLLYLYNEDNEILFKTYESFVGWDANVILEEVMNTSSVNQDIKRMIDEMYKCIEDKKYDEAEKIVDILDKKTNGYADGIFVVNLIYYIHSIVLFFIEILYPVRQKKLIGHNRIIGI